MSRPDYGTHDPKGWCGNPARGAALGRPTVSDAEPGAPLRMYLRRVRLNAGGYDPNGTYFGHGAPLYWAASDDGDVDYMVRASDRASAWAKVKATYPNARLARGC